MTITELDESEEERVAPKLLECCGSGNWVKSMLASRPFHSAANLQALATSVWLRLEPVDWLEAFSKHPQIGEKGKVSQWSAQEQSGMSFATGDVTASLAELNRLYYHKFGWIFIVCASGKSASEMLSLLQARLPNAPDDELRVAAAEQNKITLLRLQKLLSE